MHLAKLYVCECVWERERERETETETDRQTDREEELDFICVWLCIFLMNISKIFIVWLILTEQKGHIIARSILE